MKKITLFIFLTLSLVMGLQASDKAKAVKAEDELTQNIRKLLDVSGAAAGSEQAMKQMLNAYKSNPQMAVFMERFEAEINVKDLLEMLIPIYAKYYTNEDIKALLKFYETPIGQKMIKVQPALMQESMMAGQQWGQQVAAKVMQIIARRTEIDSN